MRPLDRSRGAPERAREEASQPAGSGPVVGLLLCGGHSTRMGADKARVQLGDGALIDYPLQALRSVADEVLLACGSEPRYGELGLPLVLDALAGGGPLAGLAAGLDAAARRGAQWVAVLACDMPRADAAVLRALLRQAEAQDLDACLLGLERGSQPTFAIYHARCAGPAQRALRAGERRLVSFHDGMLQDGAGADGRRLRVQVLPASRLGVDDEVATNVNTPEELELQRRALAAGAPAAGGGA